MNNIYAKNTICVGCGVCAGVCGKIQMNHKKGKNVPIVDEETCVQCGLCVRVCPFYTLPLNENSCGKRNPYIGNYLECGIGKCVSNLDISASGGLLTAFLEKAMDLKIVDAVITVKFECSEDRIFEYSIFKSAEEFKNAAGSAYYPVEISEMIKIMKKTDKRYAVVGLPCVIRGLRNAMQFDCKLKSTIRLLVGLACGGVPESTMLDYLLEDSDISSSDIKEINFRKKTDGINCNNYCLYVKGENDKEFRSYFNDPNDEKNEKYGKIFLNKAFFNDACLVCQDAVAEYADITFMDAWLPEYINQKYGTSMYVGRSELAISIINALEKDDNIELKKVPAEDVIKAQKSVNLIQSKKYESVYRAKYLKEYEHVLLDKRLLNDLSLLRKIKLLLKAKRQVKVVRESKMLWDEFISTKISKEELDRRLENVFYRK